MSKKILVVDDDEQYRELLTLGLKGVGYDVTTAENGKEGFEMAQKLIPDLIIVDLNMPVMHGFEVCQKVRADVNLSNTKIIVTSSKSYVIDIRKAKELGANLYVVKPYNFDSLLEAVRTV